MPLLKTPLIIRKGRASFTRGTATPPATNADNMNFVATTKTFTGANNGVYFPANSYVIVFVGMDNASAPTNFTIGGQPATLLTSVANRVFMYGAQMPSGAQPDTITLTSSGGIRTVSVQVAGWFKNLRSTTPAAVGASSGFGGANPQTLSASLANPGFGIACSYSVTSPTSLTWTNTTAAGGDTFSNNTVTGGFVLTLGSAHTETPGDWNTVVAGVGTSIQYGTGVVGAVWK